jgi:hypothetical protein
MLWRRWWFRRRWWWWRRRRGGVKMSEAKTRGGSWRMSEREREHVLCCRARSRGFEARSLL